MTADVVLTPPRLIGTETVALCLGVERSWVYELLAREDGRVTPGYLGKFGDRHVWNANELFGALFTTPEALWDEIGRVEAGIRSTASCGVCGGHAHILGLCRRHVNRLLGQFERSQRSSVAVWQLLAMCRWVVDRNQHLSPPAGWDPWSGICVTPGCENRTDGDPRRVSPMCLECSETLWNHYRR